MKINRGFFIASLILIVSCSTRTNYDISYKDTYIDLVGICNDDFLGIIDTIVDKQDPKHRLGTTKKLFFISLSMENGNTNKICQCDSIIDIECGLYYPNQNCNRLAGFVYKDNIFLFRNWQDSPFVAKTGYQGIVSVPVGKLEHLVIDDSWPRWIFCYRNGLFTKI